MLVIRGTKKLRDRLKTPPADAGDASTTVLGDWFATALFWRPQVALFVNQRTLLPVFMPLAPAASLLDRAPDAIAAMLRRHGADDAFATTELEAMREVRVAPTNDRSVVGVMNEFAFHGEHRWHGGVNGLEELSLAMASMPLGPLRGRTGFPDRELASVLGLDRTNVIRLPTPTAGATPPRSSTPPAASAFQLKVTLKGTKPPIWRRVLVDGSATLDEVHEVIQAAFGWWNYHLYDFEFGRTRYGVPDPDWDFGPPTRDASKSRIHEVAAPGTSFTYTYDFGDNWEHKVTVEKVIEIPPDLKLPACIDGRRAGPPEDCGGLWGYEELVAILADPSHAEHAERAEWAAGWGGASFDPNTFDPNEFADNLRNIHLTSIDD